MSLVIQNVYLHVNLIVENATQIKSGITINVNKSADIQENIICKKKVIMFGILVLGLLKMVNIQQVLLVIQ